MSDFNKEAVEFISLGRHDEAEAVLARALDEMPNNWSPLQVKEDTETGHFWDEEEFVAYCEFRSAGGAYKSIFWSADSYSYAVYLLASLHMERGDLERALELLEIGLRMEADHPETLSEYGYILQTLKRYELALEMYQKAETLRPWATLSQKARALRGQGFCLIELGRLADAQSALSRSLEFEPGSENALKELQYIHNLRDGGDTEQQMAIETLDFGFEFTPEAETETAQRQNWWNAVLDAHKTGDDEAFTKAFNASFEASATDELAEDEPGLPKPPFKKDQS